MTATTSSTGSTSPPQVVALFSRGLDSILAVKVIQQQGLRVRAVKFITPFFGWEIKGREQVYCEEIKSLYDIDLTIVDLSREYLKLLADPPNGYGKNFNPCVDCKILMLTRAREMAHEWGAAGLITGEVIGQRPFSQRRDTLHRIENLSETKGLLLRPLCAKLLPPSRLEESGLVDREGLFAFSGRGRKPQMALAAELGISDYPTPAGGCLLTDPGFGLRVRTLYESGGIPSVTAINLLKHGRFTSLGNGEFFIVGRHRNDNQELLRVADDSCYILHLAEMPGPVTVLSGQAEQLETAAAGLCRHSRAKNLENVKINWRRGKKSGRLVLAAPRPPADPGKQQQTAP
ncbi:MAG: thiamine biosynthesis protein [Deltaproteobacteria bacterium]|nr:thiamine biosynthesis protein [Deltaproteobacteria bacterium]